MSSVTEGGTIRNYSLLDLQSGAKGREKLLPKFKDFISRLSNIP